MASPGMGAFPIHGHPDPTDLQCSAQELNILECKLLKELQSSVLSDGIWGSFPLGLLESVLGTLHFSVL